MVFKGRLIPQALYSYRLYILKDHTLYRKGIPGIDDFEWGWDDEKRKPVKLGTVKKEIFNPEDYEDPWDREVARIKNMDPEIIRNHLLAIEHELGIAL